jgi:hypothetical protein
MASISWWNNLGSSYHQFYFVVSIFVCLFSFYIAFLTLKRYFERHNQIAAILATFIFLLAAALLLDPIFLLYRATTDIDLIALQSVLSFGLTGYANILLIIFLRDVFYNKKTGWYPIPIIIIEALILPVGVWINRSGLDIIPLFGLHLLMSFIIYLTQFVKSVYLQRRLRAEHKEDVVGRNGFKYIGLAGLMLFLTYVSFILQEFVSIVPELYEHYNLVQNGATIFIPIGFLLAGISAFCLYIGFLMPEWIKKRWQ